MKGSGGQSCLWKFEINKIPKIHDESDSVGDEIQPKQKFLIDFFCVYGQRQDAEQNKKSVDIKYGSGIKLGAVIGQAEVVGNRIDLDELFVVPPKQQSGDLIKNKN